MAETTNTVLPDQPAAGDTGRALGPVRIAGLAGVFVATVLGGVALGAVTDADPPTEVVAVVDDEMPILASVGRGADAPTSDALASLFPPDAAAEAEAMRKALADDPEALALEDGPAPDEVDIDGVAASLAAEGEPLATVAGIADGGPVFGETGGSSPPDATAPDTGPDGTAPDDDDPEPTDGDPGERPILVDLCAGPEPLPGCEGVGGTVNLATVEAFRFNADPVLRLDVGGCSEPSRAPEPDEFVVQLETNTLGSFTVWYRTAGSGASYVEATGETPEIWRGALDAGTVLQAVTCIVAERPPRATEGPAVLDLDIRAVGDGESGEARWIGLLDLPGPPDPDPTAPTATRRDGRPAVVVTARNASTLLVDVPVGRRGEEAEVSLVPRSADATGGECGSVPPVALGAESTSVRVRGIDEIVISDWVTERFEVAAPEAGTYWVCVDWFDDFDPPTNLERASVPVEIRGTPSLELVFAGWERGRAPGAQPESARVLLLDAGQACGSAGIADFDARAERDDPRLLCRLDRFPDHIGIRTEPDYGGDEPLTQRALVPVPRSCGGVPDCTIWYAQTIKAPDRQVAGLVVVGFRLAGAPDATPVTIGDESPELADELGLTGPRLDLASVSARPDPADPGRGAIVSWRADRPVTGTVELRAQYPTPGCTTTQSTIAAAATEGTNTFSELCPGVDYFVNFLLTDPEGNQTIYDLNGRRSAGRAETVRWSGTLQMDSLPAEFDYELAFSETIRNQEFPEGIVPTNISLEFPRSWGGGGAHEYHFRQYYDGKAYNELVCEKASDLGRSESGIPISFRGSTFRLAESRFSFSVYEPSSFGLFDGSRRRKCPSFANKFNKTPSARDCSVSIHALVPQGTSNQIGSMLDGQPAVFRSRVSMCSNPVHFFEATVTVRIRQVLELRGSTG